LVDQAALEMHGPDTFLKADAAQTMSLVLHELATNAVKFGALTKPKGRIEVDWQLDEELVDPRRIRMTWRETDGPTVAAPEKMGFGHELISSLPEHELDAEVTLEYRPGGLFWRIDMPARGAVAQLDEGDAWTGRALQAFVAFGTLAAMLVTLPVFCVNGALSPSVDGAPASSIELAW
jgi:hypothetical protein